MRSLLKTGAVLGVALAAAGAIAFSAARDKAPAALDASSHREAPAISVDPSVVNTDFYMWVTPDAPDMVTFAVAIWPFSNPSGGPNYYPFNTDAVYAVNIDNDGDAEADIVYEFTFDTHIREGNTFLYNTGPVTSLDSDALNIRQHFAVDRVDMHQGTRVHVIDEWPVVPTRFLLCIEDRFFPEAFMRRVLAERLGVIPDEIEAGHCVALSRPKALEGGGRR